MTEVERGMTLRGSRRDPRLLALPRLITASWGKSHNAAAHQSKCWVLEMNLSDEMKPGRCPLLALSGHARRVGRCPLMTQSGQTSYDVLAVRRFWHNQEGACLLAAYTGILGPSGR
jgi:hypothetical protein